MDSLPADTAAQFSAGLLYGWSVGVIDERDYIVGCTFECPYVKKQLSKAFDDYNDGDYKNGNKHMMRTQP